MHRSLFAVLLALFAAGCASHRVEGSRAPDFTYAFVVDGRVSKSVSVPALAEKVSAAVQPRSGESAIWQNYGATYAFIELIPRQQEITPSGGSVLNLTGDIQFFRDLKTTQVDGNDEIVRGKAIAFADVPRKTITVEPGAPVNVPLVEGVSVLITALPKAEPAPQP